MSRRDPKRSLSVPLKLIGNSQLEWSATVKASDLAERDSPDALRIADVEVPRDSDVRVELALEHISGGLSVAGRLAATWKGPCARCWLSLDGEIATTVREVFTAHPREGEQYRLDPEFANLAPMVREAVLLELPIEAIPCPHADPCPNLPSELAESHEDSAHEDSTGDDVAEDDSAELADPRWAALEALRGRADESS